LIEVQNYRVINPRTESTLEIITSDAPTSYGLTPDFIIADEVVHWKKRDLWDSLLSSAAKRASCMFVVITNAGLQDDWAWTLREAVRVDPLWYFSRQNGPVASWINADTLAEQERLLPSIAFRRLWLNEWTTGGGDALSPEVIAAAFKAGLRPMRGLDFMPVYGRLPEWEFVLGVDAGIVRDATALCALAVRRQHAGHGHIRLAKTKIWRPAKGQRVNLDEVENTVLDWHDEFKFKQINFDPWELRALASRLQSGGVGRMAGGPRFGKQRRESLPMVEVAPTGSNLQAQASALLETFNDRRIDLFEDADLRRDLNRMRVVEKSYGFRIESPRDEFGHGDMGSAFNLALLAASELAAKRVVVVGTGDAGQDRPMTPLERELAATRQRWESHQEHLQYLAGRPSEMAEGLARALRADGFSASDIRKRMGNG
jgi:hypothetical protein